MYQFRAFAKVENLRPRDRSYFLKAPRKTITSTPLRPESDELLRLSRPWVSSEKGVDPVVPGEPDGQLSGGSNRQARQSARRDGLTSQYRPFISPGGSFISKGAARDRRMQPNHHNRATDEKQPEVYDADLLESDARQGREDCRANG